MHLSPLGYIIIIQSQVRGRRHGASLYRKDNLATFADVPRNPFRTFYICNAWDVSDNFSELNVSWEKALRSALIPLLINSAV